MKNENAKKIVALYLDSFNVSETMQQLRVGHGKVKLMSWGARNFTNFENKGLLFRVSARRLKGYILITLSYDDTYTIHFLNMKCDVVKTMENVYCDELSEKIDKEIEWLPIYVY